MEARRLRRCDWKRGSACAACQARARAQHQQQYPPARVWSFGAGRPDIFLRTTSKKLVVKQVILQFHSIELPRLGYLLFHCCSFSFIARLKGGAPWGVLARSHCVAQCAVGRLLHVFNIILGTTNGVNCGPCQSSGVPKFPSTRLVTSRSMVSYERRGGWTSASRSPTQREVDVCSRRLPGARSLEALLTLLAGNLRQPCSL